MADEQTAIKQAPTSLGAESAVRLAQYIRIQAEAEFILMQDPELRAFLRAVREGLWDTAHFHSCCIPIHLSA
jgi:hypothetical protein